MPDSRLTDEMIEAAAEIIARHCSGRWWAAYNDQGRADKIEQSRIPAAAIARLLPDEAAIRVDERANIAAEIELAVAAGEWSNDSPRALAFDRGMRYAARVARGSAAATEETR